jgi:hypothetical protein
MWVSLAYLTSFRPYEGGMQKQGLHEITRVEAGDDFVCYFAP